MRSGQECELGATLATRRLALATRRLALAWPRLARRRLFEQARPNPEGHLGAQAATRRRTHGGKARESSKTATCWPVCACRSPL